MIDLLRDLMAHAEWANAVFFHAWDKSPAATMKSYEGGSII